MQRVLIANRGEIAVRIARACRERGLGVVAVHSEPDADAPHVRVADAAVALDGKTAAETYLSIPRIIDAARASGADAVHPGYGFLSERAAFAEACADAGLTFIGPPADAIRAMGSKIDARALMEAAGVPLVPGLTLPSDDPDAITRAADGLGYPLLVKASAGGGGKGMRRVDEAAGLREALAAARREATSAFGDGTVFLERLLEQARHVEVQIAADAHGGCVHLGERECSLQRRHQKVIEESPSPIMTPALREAMGAAAAAAARAVGYRNVGTVEFLLTGDGDDARFYFLEMNTRLQVEHPVTEAVTGLDLVHLQCDLADGLPLPWTQEGITWRGHAIECRVYAEAPARGFLPQAGRLLVYREPSGPGIRVDAGVREGQEITPYYDPLLAKVIVAAESRPRALARMREALRQFVALGVETNVDFLQRVLAHPDVEAGRVDTAWLDAHPDLTREPDDDEVHVRATEIARAIRRRAQAPRQQASAAAAHDPWSSAGAWRG